MTSRRGRTGTLRDEQAWCRQYASGMRFGRFHTQGCSFDLVGIPVAKQREVMRDLAQAADAGPFESIWLYDHFHTIPVVSVTAYDSASMDLFTDQVIPELSR